MTRNQLLAFLCLLTVIIVWSVAPSLIRAFALETGAADSIVIRMWTIAAFALPVFIWSKPRIERADYARFALIGFIGNFGYYVGSIYGFANMSAGAGGIVYACNPLMIAAWSIAIGLEKISVPVIVGMLVSFAGTVYLFSDGLDNIGANPVFGGVMMLGGCLAWTIYVIYARPMIKKYGALVVTMLISIMCALPSLIFMSGTTISTFTNLSQDAIVALLLLSIVGTLLSVGLWNFASSHLPPTSVGAALYIVTPGAIFFGWLLRGEALGPNTLVAAVVILLGVAIAEFGKYYAVKSA